MLPHLPHPNPCPATQTSVFWFFPNFTVSAKVYFKYETKTNIRQEGAQITEDRKWMRSLLKTTDIRLWPVRLGDL